MNRKQLIKWLKKNGYTGDLTLDAVKSWLQLEGYDPDSLDALNAKGEKERVALKAVWDKTNTAAIEAEGEGKGKKGRGSTATADEDDDEEGGTKGRIADLEAQLKNLQEKQRLGAGNGGNRIAQIEADDRGLERTAKDFQNIARRKAYESRIKSGEAAFPDADIAEGFAAYARLAIAKTAGVDYEQKRADVEIVKASQVEYDDTLGGSLVPVEYSTFYQKIRERYGRARQLARVVTMSRDVQEFPRRGLGTAASITVSGSSEGGTLTASTFQTGRVKLVAQKLGGLVTVSSELMRDAALNVSDLVADEIGWSFGVSEDQDFINGDGTSTYHGFNGVINTLQGLNATHANIAGLNEVEGTTAWSSVTLGDMETTASLLPDLDAATGEPCWYCNPRFYWQVMVRLMAAGGGNSMSELAEGRRVPMFLGYEVKFLRVMDRVYTEDHVPCLFGWMNLAATIGDVTGGVRIETSKDRYFDQDLFAFRAIERLAINVHDVGDASATEASRNPGPIVGIELG